MRFDQINGLPGTPIFMSGYVFVANGTGMVWINVKDYP
jgi:hypothetical protein